MKKILFTAAIILAAFTASAQVGFVSSGTSTDELRNIAIESNKLVFIDLYATWCGPCSLMDNQVFSRKDVGEYMNSRFVCAKYNIERGTGRKIAEKYGIKSIPTFLIFDTEENMVGKISGAMTGEDLIKSLNKVLTQYKHKK